MSTRQQILDYFAFADRAVRRHWQKGAAVAAVAAAAALVGTLLMPRSYYSEARLFVRFGRENQVDPTASGGQMVSLYESRESEINSLIEILKSRAVLDRVVEELGPDLVLFGQQGEIARKSDDKSQPAAIPPPKPTTSHQLAVSRLIKTVTIAAPRKSNIISVNCKAKSPELAQRIVAKLVEVYRDEHVRVHRSPGTYAFFEQQAAQSLAGWQKAADELRATKDRLGIVTIEGRRRNLDEVIANISNKRLSNQAETRSTKAKIASLEAEIIALPPTVVTQETTGASAAADGMRQSLFNLESQEKELSSKMQSGHPRLVAVRQQLLELREILRQQPAQNVQATEAINPSRQSLELSLLTERSNAESLSAGELALAAQLQQLHGEMTELNANALAIDELTQRVGLAEANHKEYTQRLEQARINRTLDDERLSSLSLVQPASYVATASGPRRSLVFALGLVIALGSGIGASLAAAGLNPLLLTAEQLVAVLDLPLLGTIPRGAMAAAA